MSEREEAEEDVEEETYGGGLDGSGSPGRAGRSRRRWIKPFSS